MAEGTISAKQRKISIGFTNRQFMEIDTLARSHGESFAEMVRRLCADRLDQLQENPDG